MTLAMLALVTVFAVVVVSLLVTRVATVALTLTGMSHEAARFQARSALSGVGFTTSEAEEVVAHPVRRRIISYLMLIGSGGIVTAVGSLILTFGGTHHSTTKLARAFVLIGGLLVIWLISRSRWVDRRLARLIARGLRWRGFHVRDYGRLLALQKDWAVGELVVESDDWMAGRTLAELKLRDEHVDVLGVQLPGGEYVGVPRGDRVIQPGDTLVLYATEQRMEELDDRKRGSAGDAAHRLACEECGGAAEPAGFHEALAG